MSSFLDNCSSYLFRNKHILFLIFLLPPLLWLGIIYLGSLLVFLFHSLFYLDGFTGKIVYKISLSTITELFTSAANIDILIRTVVLAAFVSIGAALIGFPIAYYMAKFTSPKMKIFFYLAIMLPLWSSYLVRVYSWKLILAKEGIINWFFTKLHLNWLLDLVLSIPVIGGPSLSISYIGMFLVFTYIWLPFMILPIQASLERVPNSLINASYDLGASKRQTFYKVILPLALPGIAAGSIFTFLSYFRRLYYSLYYRYFKVLYRTSCLYSSRNCRKCSFGCSFFFSANCSDDCLYLFCKKVRCI